ncbi:hypothetical protein NKG94_14325 [Micromonospora sp. M12]
MTACTATSPRSPTGAHHRPRRHRHLPHPGLLVVGRPYPGGPNRDRPRVAQHRPDHGHALIGPVAVRGARAGQTLAVRVDAVVPATWGPQWPAVGRVGSTSATACRINRWCTPGRWTR